MNVYSRVSWRLIPFMFVLYIVAYLDRINLGFAAGQMKASLGFDDQMIGMAGAIFFVGYFLFQVPANLILERIGARRWIGTIMIAWGIVSGLEACVREEKVFYGLRFLLGLAEAGFFPGMVLYLTYWFPQRERARAVSRFMTAIPCAGVIGGIVSGPLLEMRHLGLEGWQWLYICEAIPAVVLGIVVFFYLDDGPADAKWLSDVERGWLMKELATDRESRPGEKTHFAHALRDVRVWLLSLLYFSLVVDMYGISLWLPQIVGSFKNLSEVAIGWLTTLPYLLAAVGMVCVGHRSDLTGERRRHVAVSAFICAVGFGLTTQAVRPELGSFGLPLAMLGLSMAAFGMWGTLGPFWALPTAFLGGTAAAGGIALINSIGNLGGALGPYVIGYIKHHFHTFEGSFVFMAVSALIAAGLAMSLRAEKPATPSA